MDGNEHLLLDRLNPLFFILLSTKSDMGIDGFFYFDILPR